LIIAVMENRLVHHQKPVFMLMHKLFMIIFENVLILIKKESFFLVGHLVVVLHCISVNE
jgi:hypothetical protein